MVQFIQTALAVLATAASVTAAPSPALTARIPTDCTAKYTVELHDTCTMIVGKLQNITTPDLYRWNPSIGRECFNLMAGEEICVSVPGYVYKPLLGGTVFTAEQGPAPVMPNVVPQCTKFVYTDATGLPTLRKIWRDNGISMATWNSLNYPAEVSNGEYFNWAGYFSCIGTN